MPTSQIVITCGQHQIGGDRNVITYVINFISMDFYHHAGKMAMGSRLRRLSDRMTEDAAKVYALYDVALDPKWFPVFYVLSYQAEASITEIAQIIGHSHPSVSQIVKEMKRQGVVITDKSQQDARVNVVKLSDEGKTLLPKLNQQYLDVTQAVENLLLESQSNLWRAIAEVEFLLTEKGLFERVREARKARECQQVEIIDYSPEFLEDFKHLNYEWIEKHFTLEETDRQYLDHPDEKVLKPGGHIYMARYEGNIVGTCAVVKIDAHTYELAKMAVTESARGRGIGKLLAETAIAKARELGAKSIYIESNTALEPAIRLYQKLGFQKIIGHPSPYERCNIQMEMKL